MKPCRIQLSRRKGWTMPPNTVKVDRSTEWGNPYRVQRDGLGHWEIEDTSGDSIVTALFRTRAEAVEASLTMFRALVAEEEIDLALLRGKNLACWCGLDKSCHADVLLELANKEARDGS